MYTTPFTPRGKICAPEFPVEVLGVLRLDWLQAHDFLWTNHWKEALVEQRWCPSVAHIKILLRNFMHSQGNPRTIGMKAEDSQHIHPTVACTAPASSLRHSPGAWAWAGGQTGASQWSSSVFFVFNPSREVEDKNHAGDLRVGYISEGSALGVSLIQFAAFSRKLFSVP